MKSCNVSGTTINVPILLLIVNVNNIAADTPVRLDTKYIPTNL